MHHDLNNVTGCSPSYLLLEYLRCGSTPTWRWWWRWGHWRGCSFNESALFWHFDEYGSTQKVYLRVMGRCGAQNTKYSPRKGKILYSLSAVCVWNRISRCVQECPHQGVSECQINPAEIASSIQLFIAVSPCSERGQVNSPSHGRKNLLTDRSLAHWCGQVKGAP